ncbi:MAG: exodeoxyribonuclease VII small subunit [Phycisphaerales bacterium]|nr:exodeoxyribonuclease VII small subunit [Phycisphaerales bacterium]
MSSKAKSSKPAAVETLRFEQATQELEQIIERIEHGEIELEDSLEAYRRGLDLVKRCRVILDAAERQVEDLTVEELEEASEEGE